MTWSRRVRFEDWFQKKNFAIKDAIYQSWLTLKRASIVTEAEALDALIAESIPKNLKRSKAKRNLGYPPNAARWDCTGSEWRWWGQGVRSKRNQEETRKLFACCLFKVFDEFWMKCFDGMSFISSIFYNIIFVSLLNVLKIKVTYLSHCIQFSFISSFQLIE